MSKILRPLRFLVKAMTHDRSVGQIAGAVALGVAIGLIPKANLICLMLVGLLFVLRLHLAAGLATAVVFTWVGIILDPVSHYIGSTLLGAGCLQSTLGVLYETPVVPWTAFNNTVVCGSCVLAVVLYYPTFRCTRWLLKLRAAGRPPRVTEDVMPAGRFVVTSKAAT